MVAQQLDEVHLPQQWQQSPQVQEVPQAVKVSLNELTDANNQCLASISKPGQVLGACRHTSVLAA